MEYPALIDALRFATSYNAVWSTLTPTCESFIRRVNLDGLERFAPPMTGIATKQRVQIAELGFSHFVELVLERENNGKRDRESIFAAAVNEVDKRLRHMEQRGFVYDKKLRDDEIAEAIEISSRIQQFIVHMETKNVIVRPHIQGCGIIDESEADIISDRTIIEIKTVDRQFRSIDIRQAITYAALNSINSKYTIDDLCLCNPRSGLYYIGNVEDVCHEISGISSVELFNEIISIISSGAPSR